MRLGMSPNTAFNLGLTMALAGLGFAIVVVALDRQYLIAAAIVCFVLAAIALVGAALGHYRRSATRSIQSDVVNLPSIRAISPDVRQAHRTKDGRVQLGLGPVATTLTMRHALLARFRNEPSLDRQTRDAAGITAIVMFGEGNTSASGYWLESYSSVDMKQGEERSVVVAFVVEQEHAELVNIGPQTGLTFWTCPQKTICPANEFPVTVKLMHGGHVVVEADYEIRLSSQRADLKLIGEKRATVERDSAEQRSLDDNQRSAILSTLSNAVDVYKDSHTIEQWPLKERDGHRFKILVVALGNDPETLTYRDQIASIFDSAGLESLTEEWSPGPPEYEAFLDRVTLLHGDSRNVIRPMVMKSLRAAGIEVREATEPFHGRNPRRVAQSDRPADVRLVVGQGR